MLGWSRLCGLGSKRYGLTPQEATLPAGPRSLSAVSWADARAARAGSARLLPEGRAKATVRAFVLNFQHSLPTELVVNKGETVVQVGTPNPKTMMRFVRAVGDRGRLVIVEARPENQQRLEKAILAKGLTNVILVKAAACDENGFGELAVSPLWGDHKIPLSPVTMDNDLRRENSQMKRIPVRLVRLDNILPEYGVTAIDYLSVTVNGAEAEVLRGAADLLAKGSRWARVYAKDHALDENGQPIHRQSDAVLRPLGYRTKVTRGGAVLHPRPEVAVASWRPLRLEGLRISGR